MQDSITTIPTTAKRKRRGFTIVELLIVIVVIGILATLTIVAYSGIQQRANNVAIIDAASKARRMIQVYIIANSQYPYTVNGVFACITLDTTCRRNSPPIAEVSAFSNAMATVGTLPRSAPLVSDVRGGVTYHYSSTQIVDGISAPAILSYYIFGINSDCGLPALNTESSPAITSSSGYTIGNVGGTGVTQCVVSIPGSGV